MKVIGAITLFILMVLLHAFTVSQLWAWFIVPLGAQAISMAHAYGIGIIITYFKQNIVKKEQNDNIGELMVNGVLFTGMTLLLGWLTTLFM